MGFPVGHAEFLLPKLLVHIADLIGRILRLIAWAFSSVGLADLLLNSTSTSTSTTSTFQTTISWHTHRSQYMPKSKSRQSLIQNAIPAVKYEDSHHDGASDGGTCAVCLQEFAARDDVRKLSNCWHVFHKCCIDPWVELDRTTCPLCRSPFVPEEMKEMDPLAAVSYYYYDEDYDGDNHYSL